MMRHVPVSIFAIVAVVGIATLLLSTTLIPLTGPLAVQYVGRATGTQGNTVIARLDVNELLGDEVESLTEVHLDGLKSGTVHGADGRTDYVQALRFKESGLFNGGRIVFGRSEQREVSDFLEFLDSVFKLQIEFGSGLRSKVEDGKMVDIEDEDFVMLGDRYSIVDTDVNTATKRISIKMFGGFGSIEFTDNNYADNNYQTGVKVNGQSISARVRIKAIDSGNHVTVYSINYILDADSAVGGDLQVLPLHCVREYLQYPTGMLSPNLDICYKGLGGAVPSGASISGNEVRIIPSGDDEYVMVAVNTRGQRYDIPLAQLPGSYGNNGRSFIFVEAGAPGAPNIPVGAYFLVNSKNDIFGSSHVLRYDSIADNTVYFEDLSGGQRPATFDPATGEGQLLVGDGTYRFVVGAGNSLAVDQTNDGNINGGEARFVFAGGSRADFGPGFTVTITTPERLFDEPMGDENTVFNILFGGHIDLDVPSPQGTTFELHGVDGRKQGLTRYGILFDWDTESDSDDLRLIVPGAYSGVRGSAAGEVYITLERPKLMKKTDVPAPPPRCGDKIITGNEYCDPPGSLCAGKESFERGACSNDCLSCTPLPKAACGNMLLEKGEECEAPADCAAGKTCNNCKCVPRPPAVCGNKLLEPGEECESAADCSPGLACNGCKCARPNCAILGKCRVWGGCGAGGDLLMIDGASKGCVDPHKSAAEGVPYCGAFPLARGGQSCNYMDANTKESCVCPSAPARELPAPVERATLWQRFRAWLRALFAGPRAVPEVEYAALAVGANCANAAPCRFWDDRCGKGYEPLHVDGVFKQCVEVYSAAGKGIPYCAHKPIAQENAYCNYMSSDPREKLPCLCR